MFERNITCSRCGFRHAPSLTCTEARRLSHEARVLRHKQIMAAIALEREACILIVLGDCSEDKEELEDPTPWCSACGAKREKDCHCGPIAENE